MEAMPDDAAATLPLASNSPWLELAERDGSGDDELGEVIAEAPTAPAVAEVAADELD